METTAQRHGALDVRALRMPYPSFQRAMRTPGLCGIDSGQDNTLTICTVLLRLRLAALEPLPQPSAAAVTRRASVGAHGG